MTIGNFQMCEQLKRCRKCHEVLPVASFYKDKSRKDGITCYCKGCLAKKNLAYRNANKLSRDQTTGYQPVAEQQCSVCAVILPVSSFHVSQATRSGYVPACKECAATRDRLRHSTEKSREKRKQAHRASRDAMTDAYMRELLARGSNLGAADLPDALVAVKRIQIEILRAAKDMDQ